MNTRAHALLFPRGRGSRMRAETEFRHVYFTKEEQKGERGGRGERERENRDYREKPKRQELTKNHGVF